MRRTRVTVDLLCLAAAVALLLALAGCGASGHGRASGPFAWLRPASPPTGWNVARIHGGAILAYPPGWTPIRTDPGTASFALSETASGSTASSTRRPGKGQRRSLTGAAFARSTTGARATARAPPCRDHRRALSLGTRGLRHRHLHDLQSQLPRDRVPRLWPTTRARWWSPPPPPRCGTSRPPRCSGLSRALSRERPRGSGVKPHIHNLTGTMTMTALSPPNHRAGPAWLPIHAAQSSPSPSSTSGRSRCWPPVSPTSSSTRRRLLHCADDRHPVSVELFASIVIRSG